jgi:hypothetical protein
MRPELAHYLLNRRIPAVAELAGLLLLVSSAPVHGQEDVARQAVAANKASIEMIRTLYAEVEIGAPSKDEKPWWTGRYWRENNVVRIQETLPDRIVDVLYKDGHVSSISTLKNVNVQPSTITMIIGDRNRRCVETDAWEACFFTLPVTVNGTPSLTFYSLEEAIQAGQITLQRWENGKPRLAHIGIELQSGKRKYHVWIDPAVNWLIRKCTHETFNADGKPMFRIEHEVEEFAEAKPTIYVPVLTKTTIRFKNGPAMHRVTRLDNLLINEPLPPIVPWPIPENGGRVLDEVNGTIYSVDRTGKKVGREQTWGGDYSPPSPPARDPLAKSNATFFFGVSLVGIAGVLVLGGYIVLVRRKRG